MVHVVFHPTRRRWPFRAVACPYLTSRPGGRGRKRGGALYATLMHAGLRVRVLLLPKLCLQILVVLALRASADVSYFTRLAHHEELVRGA